MDHIDISYAVETVMAVSDQPTFGFRPPLTGIEHLGNCHASLKEYLALLILDQRLHVGYNHVRSTEAQRLPVSQFTIASSRRVITGCIIAGESSKWVNSCKSYFVASAPQRESFRFPGMASHCSMHRQNARHPQIPS